MSGAAGPLAGLRAVEWGGTAVAQAGRLLADLGADVIKVEPPDGDATRTYPPFVDDAPDPDRSLFFWTYNTSKRSLTVDVETEAGRTLLRRLIGTADILLEGQPPGRMAALGLDEPDLRPDHPGLIYVSITPFGRSGPRHDDPATDLTLLAGGGPAWSCGYDDHTLPPVRGGGNQGEHIGAHWAVMGALTALAYRDQTGTGQHMDVNTHAGCNVTTEAGSYSWLVAQETVQRQTGRHAAVNPSAPTQVQAQDGVWVTTGIPPRRPEEFGRMLDWLAEHDLLDRFDRAPILELGRDGEPMTIWQLMEDPEAQEKFLAGREAVTFLAENLPAAQFFREGQERGFQFGIIYAPEDVMEDPHFQDRGFAVPVEHPELGRTVTYPGAPYRFTGSPWRIGRRPPLVGEDTDAVLTELGLDADAIASLRRDGAV